jgi:hypothetical protein
MQFTVAQSLLVYPFRESHIPDKRATFFTKDEAVPDGTILEINEELAFFMHKVVFFEFRNRYVCCSAVEFRRRARPVGYRE